MKKHDPYYQRELDKYGRAAPSREFIIQQLEKINEPATFEMLAEAFHLTTEEEHEGLRRRLIAMSRDGQLFSNRRGGYALIDKLALVRGRVQAHKDGFGFVIAEDGKGDVFLPAREMRQVFNDDVVLVSITSQSRQRREGSIVEVLERNTREVVGRYFVEGGVGFIDPDSKTIHQDIHINPEDSLSAKPGQYVVAEIIVQPGIRARPVAKITEILGDKLTSGMEVALALRTHEIPHVWPDDVLAEVSMLADTLTSADLHERQDLRHLPFVTIDGEDAKDFDDAVYCEQRKTGGWKLWVAIADVSHYVQPGSALDKEARKRGTSVYFPNEVVPMLPEKLSNGLCSLVPKQDRLVMVAELTVTQQGELTRSNFYPGVIHSHARLTYTAVAKTLAEKTKNHEDYWLSVVTLHQLFQQLLKQRKKRGAIDFDVPETQILFDSEGKISQIKLRTRNDAHRMIEEAMLLANMATAKWLVKAKIPTLYRNHEPPEAEKLDKLRDFLKPFGLRLTGGKAPQANDYAKLLTRIEKREDSDLLQTVLLRSLRQAVYSSEVLGHFGLAYEAYLHFTSPIRRYPDLQVHRAMKHGLEEKKVRGFYCKPADMVELGEHCSMTERRADRATRDALDWLKCFFMQDKVGQRFRGKICEVTSFGVFVRLDAEFVEGLLHVTALTNDYYKYEPVRHLLRGQRTGKVYQLGDPIEILVARVDLDQRQIDFELAGQQQHTSRGKGKK